MANEGAWGAALQSLGGSVTDYYKQKSTEQAQAEKDRKLAEAILKKDEQAKAEEIAKEQRVAGYASLREHITGRTPMMAAQPEVLYTGPFDQPMPGTSYAGRILSPAQPERPIPDEGLPSYYKGMFGGTPMPGTILGEREPKAMTEYQEQSLLLRKERESRMKKYAEYTRSQGLNGKLTDAQIASIYKTVDDKYDMDFNLLGKLRQGLITQDEIDEMRALEKLNLVRSVAETGKAARGGNIPAKPKAKEEPKPKSAGDIADGTIKTVGSKKFVRSGGAWVQQ